MLFLQTSCTQCFQAPNLFKPSQKSHFLRPRSAALDPQAKRVGNRRVVVRCCKGEEEKKAKRRSFLSLEEAGLVEISGLSTHERFLCRLTISSLNLLRVISEQEGVSIEELNAGRVCDWFLKDKLKREQDIGSAVLQWDDSEFQI
ncbi:ArsR-like helix-turn-helix domain-containing protein [Dioscorea alata]|uniref:ArsR-like helix-turn-helix domain-containing protein n=1 Tax=Dioscorea alata TaxID=55571 RepID=A0ACB7TY17_DIOAL|nr:ArsR-like helix-turn-helix domain-containing protein [Dioscorea alata]